MSTNLKTARFDTETLTYKIVSDAALRHASNDDVTASSGFLHSITVANGSNVGYLKITLTEATVVVGTTVPDIIIKVLASTTVRVTMPSGVAFTKLSFWQTTTGADSNNTSAAAQFDVTLVTT
tara:strand:+ start:44 stop:412 length:369 start_codon:yes stop_codon:yes gene_type:complete